MTEHNPIAAYWLKHYATEFCTLCGNSGVIDTRGVRTAAGISAGRLNYCICPNGQEMRGRGVNLVEYAATHLYAVLVITPSDSLILACSCVGQGGHVPHNPHCTAHLEYGFGRPALPSGHISTSPLYCGCGGLMSPIGTPYHFDGTTPICAACFYKKAEERRAFGDS